MSPLPHEVRHPRRWQDDRLPGSEETDGAGGFHVPTGARRPPRVRRLRGHRSTTSATSGPGAASSASTPSSSSPGFLITSLLLRERSGTGRISLGGFWARRARRLLPAVFLLLIVVVVYGSTDDERRSSSTSCAATRSRASSTSRTGTSSRPGQSYFDLFLPPSPLQHLWSLAIEEQFYLLWPLIVVGVLKLASGSRTALFVVTIAGIVISQLCMALLYDDDNPSRAYYGTEARAHTLLVGCLLALLLADRLEVGAALRRVLAVGRASSRSASCLVIFSTASASAAPLLRRRPRVLDPRRDRDRGRRCSRRARCGSFLGLPPLRYIGRISYGLYLWHWPVIVFVDGERTGPRGQRGSTWCGSLITVAITLASYYLIERPVLRGVLKPRLALVALPVSIVGRARR